MNTDENMSGDMNVIQAFYFGAFTQAIRCDEETDGEVSKGAFVRRMGDRIHVASSPPPVQSAYDYYYKNIEQQDWGGVSVYNVTVGRISTYAVHATCDGDEEWLELYSEDGEELGFGKIYVNDFEYTDKQTLRSTGIGD